MALPLPPGLTPDEVAFLCEMELVTIIPRQRLEGLDLLGGPIRALNPPHRANIPLWLALLLKRQRRANIVAPPWLHPATLSDVLEIETDMSKQAFSPPPKLPAASGAMGTTSPPFLPSSTVEASSEALPYHWLELGEILLEAASDDIEDPDQVRRLMRDLREVRMSKLRAGVKVLEAGAGVKMNGVGGMEIAEGRAFIVGVIDGLRRIGTAREQARREQEAEQLANGFSGTQDDDDDDMEL